MVQEHTRLGEHVEMHSISGPWAAKMSYQLLNDLAHSWWWAAEADVINSSPCVRLHH